MNKKLGKTGNWNKLIEIKSRKICLPTMQSHSPGGAGSPSKSSGDGECLGVDQSRVPSE